MEINIIFPIAGLGSRFGNVFKPFLLATEETFIELAKKPFNNIENKNFYFIFRQSQEEKYHVSETLKKLFPNDNINFCIIGDTNGPLQTLQCAIDKYNITGPSFVCDCDHSINITPMLEKLNILTQFDVFIPTWDIELSDYENWGKVILENGNIKTFCEKEFIQDNEIKGLIGCYLFCNIELLLNYPRYENISDVLKIMHQENKNLLTIPIKEASFFGIPETLQKFRFQRAQKYTLFIDVEGTLINQETKELLPNSIDKLNKWIDLGHTIILTTATDETRIMKHIKKYNIPYHRLICDITPGPRYLINDKKPYIPYYTMAAGFQINRNEGISHIEFPSNSPTIIKEFEGASMTHVYLLSNKVIRKYTNNNQIDVLKRQCEDLKRLYFYNNSMFPKVIHEHGSIDEFYYDMEYLENYTLLSNFDKEKIYTLLYRILTDLHTYVYCYKKYLTDNEKDKWMQEFFNTKLIPKYPLLLKHNEIYINNIQYKSIYYYLENIKKEDFYPEFICPIHGDLTLENIMYDSESNLYKLIDPAGSRYMDAIEMDIGKLFQSLVCDYSSWKSKCDLTIVSDNSYLIPEKYLCNKYEELKLLVSEKEYKKGVFYMCTYFIRMIPYMKNKSQEHVLFVQLLTIYYLSTLI